MLPVTVTVKVQVVVAAAMVAPVSVTLAGLVASTANVLLLDEPTNNLDPASREQVLDALRSYQGAVVLVTHDPGAAEALDPQRVVLLPDGTEDHWSEEYSSLIELA